MDWVTYRHSCWFQSTGSIFKRRNVFVLWEVLAADVCIACCLSLWRVVYFTNCFFPHFNYFLVIWRESRYIQFKWECLFVFSLCVYFCDYIIVFLLYIHYTTSIFNLMHPTLLFYSAYHHAILLVRGIVLSLNVLQLFSSTKVTCVASCFCVYTIIQLYCWIIWVKM